MFCQNFHKTTDTLNPQFSFPCIAFSGEYGIGYDYHNDEYYTSSWTSDSISNYDIDGEFVEAFTIPGVSNMRDMTYDGEFFYGGNNNYFFYVVDMQVRELYVKWDMPVKVHSIAYDHADELFWINEEGSNTLYSCVANGTILDSVEIDYNAIEISGLATENEYYGTSADVWLLCQDSIHPFLIKYSTTTKNQIGYEIDLSTIVNENAVPGGLFSFVDNWWYDGNIVGVFQNELAFVFEFNYLNQLVSTGHNTLPSKFEVYPVPASEKIIIETSDIHQKLTCRIINQTGQILNETTGLAAKFEFDISNFRNGNYFVQIIADEGFTLTKKFVKK